MTIELDKNSYVVGIWFSSDPDTGNDWLGCVFRDPEQPERFKFTSRFRYKKDDGIFESEDEKRWMSFISSPGISEDDAIESMTKIQNKISEGYPDIDSVIIKGGLDKFFELTKDKPWIFKREERIN